MSITPDKLRSWLAEDYSGWDAAKLRYQLDWMMRHCLEAIEDKEKQRRDQVAAIRGHMTASSWLHSELLAAERAGRKTVRIADLMAASQAHYDAARVVS